MGPGPMTGSAAVPLTDRWLVHDYDPGEPGRDRIAYGYGVDFSRQPYCWRFQVQYLRDPSGGNNWGFFLAADHSAKEMHPSGAVDGYVVGVNYSGHDDVLKLWKVISGSGYELLNTGFNWQERVAPGQPVGVEVTVDTLHRWRVRVDTTGSFDDLRPAGDALPVYDTFRLEQVFFGLYYEYTSTGARCLRMDDVYLGPPVADTLAPRVINHQALHPSLLEVAFSEPMDSLSLTRPAHYTFLDSERFIGGVVTGPATPETVHLQPSQPLVSGAPCQLHLSGLSDRPGNLLADTVLSFNYNRMQVDSVYTLSRDSVMIIYSRAIDSASGLDPAHYDISSLAGKTRKVSDTSLFKVILGGSADRVILKLCTPLEPGRAYRFAIEGVEDRYGEAMEPASGMLHYNRPVPWDVVISEVMADPDPPVGLPMAEYVELYNTRHYPLSLQGCRLIFGRHSFDLGDVCIPGGGYLVVCDSSDRKAFQNLSGPTPFVCAIPSMPALLNDGSRVVLENRNQQVVAFVDYTRSWYEPDWKCEGGWSLEQVDPFNPCAGHSNWRASEAAAGGTPGQANSVAGPNPDHHPPRLLYVGMPDSCRLCLHFSEPMLQKRIINPRYYRVDGRGHPDAVVAAWPDARSAILTYETPFQPGTHYQLSLEGNLCDCVGRGLSSPGKHPFEWPAQPRPGHVVINEVLFDPWPGGSDYVEVYNASAATFDLADIGLTGGDGAKLKSRKKPSHLFFPGQHVVFTESPGLVHRHYHVEHSRLLVQRELPAFPDEAGRVILTGPENRVIDRMDYHADMHLPLLTSDEGVALERVNPTVGSDDPDNWHSAAQSAGYGTPTCQNSQFVTSSQIKPPIRVSPEVFSPDQDGRDDRLHIHYRFNRPGNVVSIRVYDARGRLVQILANNRSLETNGMITWDGRGKNRASLPQGIYVIDVEVLRVNGHLQHYRLACVLARAL